MRGAEGFTPDTWRENLVAQQEARARSLEVFIQRFALVLLTLTTLYVFIGPQPWVHNVQLDEATGDTSLSPVNRYAWILLGGMSMPLLFLRRHLLKSALVKIWPLILLVTWFAMSTRWALDPAASNRRFFVFIIYNMIALATALGFNSTEKLHRAFVIACAIMIGIDMFTIATMWGASQTEIGLAAIHSHKNVLGGVMLFCGLMIAPFILTQRTWGGRFLWLGVLLCAILLLVLSRSKTSMAILFAVLLLLPLIVLILRIRGGVFLALGAVLLIALLAALMLWIAYCSLEARDVLGPVRGITFTARTDIWAFVFAEIFKHPIRGSGFGSFWDIDSALQPSLLLGDDVWFANKSQVNEAHNGYLDLFVTTGVVGLVASLVVIFGWMGRGLSLLRKALRSLYEDERARAPAFMALGLFPSIIFAHNFMESSLFAANSIFSMLVLITGVSLQVDDVRMRSDDDLPPSYQHH